MVIKAISYYGIGNQNTEKKKVNLRYQFQTENILSLRGGFNIKMFRRELWIPK